MVILLISVLFLCAVAIEQSDASHKESMQDFYRTEYQHCYPVDS